MPTYAVRIEGETLEFQNIDAEGIGDAICQALDLMRVTEYRWRSKGLVFQGDHRITVEKVQESN